MLQNYLENTWLDGRNAANSVQIRGWTSEMLQIACKTEGLGHHLGDHTIGGGVAARRPAPYIYIYIYTHTHTHIARWIPWFTAGFPKKPPQVLIWSNLTRIPRPPKSLTLPLWRTTATAERPEGTCGDLFGGIWGFLTWEPKLAGWLQGKSQLEMDDSTRGTPIDGNPQFVNIKFYEAWDLCEIAITFLLPSGVHQLRRANPPSISIFSFFVMKIVDFPRTWMTTIRCRH